MTVETRAARTGRRQSSPGNAASGRPTNGSNTRRGREPRRQPARPAWKGAMTEGAWQRRPRHPDTKWGGAPEEFRGMEYGLVRGEYGLCVAVRHKAGQHGVAGRHKAVGQHPGVAVNTGHQGAGQHEVAGQRKVAGRRQAASVCRAWIRAWRQHVCTGTPSAAQNA